jgi:DNA polymerase III subunit delta
MPEAKPIVYILRGDDRQAIEELLRDLQQKIGDSDIAEMNITHLEGKSTSLNDLRAAALAMPFLTERRLVILEDALQPYSGKEGKKEREQFLKFLDSLPQSTGLILVVPDSIKYQQGQLRWEKLDQNHWLMKWTRDAGERAYVQDCPLPTESKMQEWIREKVGEMDGEITPQGANTLASYVGNNTQRAIREIDKLLTYVNFERPIEDKDVRKLTAQDRQADIFDLVDAIGSREGPKALDLLHLLLEDMDFVQLFGMIVRQFRLLLEAREIMDDGGNAEDVAKTLHQHPFVARKVTEQARHFDLPTLAAIYHQLLMIDVDSKTGQMEGDVALDILIARLAD